jgi:hypothetical protein
MSLEVTKIIPPLLLEPDTANELLGESTGIGGEPPTGSTAPTLEKYLYIGKDRQRGISHIPPIATGTSHITVSKLTAIHNKGYKLALDKI